MTLIPIVLPSGPKHFTARGSKEPQALAQFIPRRCRPADSAKWPLSVVGLSVSYSRVPLYLHLQFSRLTPANDLFLPGKSSLTVQFVEGEFVESYYPTIENTFSKVIKYKNQDFATEIVDTAGQVRRTAFQVPPGSSCCSNH